MFGYFYNSSIRRYIVIMGQLFNGIQVARERDGLVGYKKVPITYASKERFAIKLNSIASNMDDNGIARVEQILPRMNLSLVDLIYNQQFKTYIGTKKVGTGKSGTESVGRNNPVPYKFMFELQIATRYEDDMLQIIEQILPYFQPNFNTKITELHDSATAIDRDVQITLQSVSMSEELEGAATERRRLQWDLVFELDGWLYPPITNLKGEIKTVYLDFHANRIELTDKDNFESIDFEVKPDAVNATWDGTYNTSYTENIPVPVPPQEPGIR